MSKAGVDLKNLRRILSYVFKYKFAIAMFAVSMCIYSGATYGKIWLSQKLMDDVLAPLGAKKVSASELKKEVLEKATTGETQKTAEQIKEEEEQRAGLEQRKEALIQIILLAVALGLIGAFAHFAMEMYRRTLMYRSIVDIRTEVGSHMLTLSLDTYHERKGGDLINRMTNDLQVAQRAIQFMLEDMVQAPVMMAAGITFAFILSWQLSVVTFIVLPILFFILIRFGKRIRRHSQQSLERLADVTEHMMQMFSGIRIVKSFGLEQYEREDFIAANERYFSRAMKMVRAKIVAKSLLELFYTFAMVLLILVGTYLVLEGIGGVTLGVLTAFLGILAGLSQPLKNGVRAFTELSEAVAGGERVFELLELKPTVRDLPDAKPVEKIAKTIAFKNVSFKYDENGPWVLEKVSFTANVGGVYAFVGKTGAGKSTILDLVCRFYEPSSGAIEIDGKDYRSFTMNSYLKQIAIVSQHPFLFNTTIHENIRLGRIGASDAEVLAAADAALVTDFASKKPEGFQTAVGDRGENLSGGERQRVTIARALLKNSPILILDEATSSLDSSSEALVKQALDRLMEGRTTFVVAHRLSTIMRADRIIIIDGGRVVQEGKHEELLAQGGLYADLYNQQFGIETPEGGNGK